MWPWLDPLLQGVRPSIPGSKGSAQEAPAEAVCTASCSAAVGAPSPAARASHRAGVSPKPGHGQMQQFDSPTDANSVASGPSLVSAGCLSADFSFTAGLEATQRDHQAGPEELDQLVPLSQPPADDSPAAETPDISRDSPHAHTEPHFSTSTGTSDVQNCSPVDAPAQSARALQQPAAADKQLQQAAEAEAAEDGAPAMPGNTLQGGHATLSDVGGLPQPATVGEQLQHAAEHEAAEDRTPATTGTTLQGGHAALSDVGGLPQQAAADEQLQEAAEADAAEDGAPATTGNTLQGGCATLSDVSGLPQPAAVGEPPQQADEAEAAEDGAPATICNTLQGCHATLSDMVGLPQQAAADEQLQDAAEAEAAEVGAPATPGNTLQGSHAPLSDVGGPPQRAAVGEQPQQAAATSLTAEEELGPAVPADTQQAGLQTREASVLQPQSTRDEAGQPAVEPSGGAGALQLSEEPSIAEEGHQAVVTVVPATWTGGVSEPAADLRQEASAVSGHAVGSSQQLDTDALSAQPGDPHGHEVAAAVVPPALPPPPTSPTILQQPLSSFSKSSDEAAPRSTPPSQMYAAEPKALPDMPSESLAEQVQQASRKAPAPESSAASPLGQPAAAVAVTAAADGGVRGLQHAKVAGDLQQLDAMPGHADEAQAAGLPPAQLGQQLSGPPDGWQAGAAHANPAVSQAVEALQEESGLTTVQVPTPAPEKPIKGQNDARDGTESAGRHCAGLPEPQPQLPQGTALHLELRTCLN